MVDNVRPCPCCGAPGKLDTAGRKQPHGPELVNWYRVRCTYCSIMTSWQIDGVRILFEWNRRAGEMAEVDLA